MMRHCQCAIKQFIQSPSTICHLQPIVIQQTYHSTFHSTTQIHHIKDEDIAVPPGKSKIISFNASSRRIEKIASKGLNVQRKKMEMAFKGKSFRLNGRQDKRLK